MLSQCTDVRTKEEYDRSHKDLTTFLHREDTLEALGKDCVNAAIALQNNLKTKENKLAGYRRTHVKCCMDACTTSPAESNNNTIKHGSFPISSKLNLSNSVQRLLKGINKRLERRRNQAIREEYITNKASCAPTSDYVIPKGQALMDRNYDDRLCFKSARLSYNSWIVWNFDYLDDEELTSHLQLYLPRFYRVHKLHTYESDGDCFVHCSCGGRINEGVPCTCFFAISEGKIDAKNIMDLGMIDVRYLRSFNARYGDDSDLGETLYDAQQECFARENDGTKISQSYMEHLLQVDENVSYPILGPNTTEDDFDEAEFVIGNKQPVTRLDMEIQRCSEEGFSLSELTSFFRGDDLEKMDIEITHGNAMMQDGICRAVGRHNNNSKEGRGFQPNSKEVSEMRKDWVETIDSVLNDTRGDMVLKQEFGEKIEDAWKTYREEVDKEWGKNGGGEGRLELAGETSEMGPAEVRKKGVTG